MFLTRSGFFSPPYSTPALPIVVHLLLAPVPSSGGERRLAFSSSPHEVGIIQAS